MRGTIIYDTQHECYACIECGDFVGINETPGTCSEHPDDDVQCIECDCLKDVRSDVLDMVTAWLSARRSDSFRITGERMGWRGLSGYRDVTRAQLEADPVELVAPMTSELRQEWTFKGNSLTVRQWHHDTPFHPETYRIRTHRGTLG